MLPCSAIANQEKKPAKAPLKGFPVTGNHGIEKGILIFEELEHILFEKVDQLF